MSSNHKETVALKDYLCLKIEKVEKHLLIRLEAIEKATTLAKNDMDVRLDGMNEFRAALKDQGTYFITRNEHVVLYDKLFASTEAVKNEVRKDLNIIKEDIHSLEETRAELRGKASQSQTNIALLISFSGLIMAGISILLGVTG